MNCVKVQEAIWCGELTLEMQQHIATCEDCQREQRNVQGLSFSMEQVQVPVQSRSLLPSKQEIEKTLKARKRKMFTKWGISGVAAVACVLAAVMVIPSFLRDASPKTDATASLPSQNVDDRPHTMEIRVPARDATAPTPNVPADASGKASATTPSNSPASVQQPTADQPYVTVADGIDDKYVQQADDIKNAMISTFDPSMFKHITIQNLEQDMQNSDENNLSFVVTLFVQHQPNKGSAYGTGDVTTQRFAHFTNQRGMWTYDGLSTSPFILTKQTNAWHEVFVKNNDKEVATFKIPPFLEAQNNADGSITLTNQGKQMGMLEIEMQVPHHPDDYSKAVSLPNGSKVVDQQITNYNAIHIVQYTLQYDDTTVSGAGPATGTRLYFMRDDKVAYDLSFPEGAIASDMLNQLMMTFSIAP